MGRYVRYLHAQPELDGVDILDGELTVVCNLRFGQVTPYLFADRPEEFVVEVEGVRLTDVGMYNGEGAMTTYVLTGEKENPILIGVEDPVGNVEGEAILRMANFSGRDAALYIGALPEEMELFLSSASPGEVTEYTGIASGNYFADLRQDNGDEILARIPTLWLRKNVAYSLYVIGTKQDWKVVLVVDGASYLPYSLAK